MIINGCHETFTHDEMQEKFQVLCDEFVDREAVNTDKFEDLSDAIGEIYQRPPINKNKLVELEAEIAFFLENAGSKRQMVNR